MTYMFDGKQYIAVAAGSNIIALARSVPIDMKHWMHLSRPRHAEPAAAPQVPQAESRTPASTPRSTCPMRSPATTGARASTGPASIAQPEWNGHEYFGQWFEQYDPKIHDAITGPVEEFLTDDAGLGYDEAQAGRDLRPDRRRRRAQAGRARYRRFETYDIVDPGTWTVKKQARSDRVRARAAGHRGYAYVYRKTLRLGKDTLVLEHHLKNTGRKPISTSVYDHDFFMLDRPDRPGRTSSCDSRSTSARQRPLNGLAEIRGKEIVFLKNFEKGRPCSPRSRASARRRRTTTSGSRTARPAPASTSPAIGR